MVITTRSTKTFLFLKTLGKKEKHENIKENHENIKENPENIKENPENTKENPENTKENLIVDKYKIEVIKLIFYILIINGRTSQKRLWF